MGFTSNPNGAILRFGFACLPGQACANQDPISLFDLARKEKRFLDSKEKRAAKRVQQRAIQELVRADIEHCTYLVQSPCRIAAPSAVLPETMIPDCVCRGGYHPPEMRIAPAGRTPHQSADWFAMTCIYFVIRVPASRGIGRGETPVRSALSVSGMRGSKPRLTALAATPVPPLGSPPLRGVQRTLPLVAFLEVSIKQSPRSDFRTGRLPFLLSYDARLAYQLE